MGVNGKDHTALNVSGFAFSDLDTPQVYRIKLHDSPVDPIEDGHDRTVYTDEETHANVRIALLDSIIDKSGVSKGKAAEILDGLFETMFDVLKHNRAIRFPKIGQLLVIARAARWGMDPRTRERIVIPESKTLQFKTSSTMTDAMNP
ncbi:hypothetical protein CCP4SC76_5090003 [Gammaproteobacteria bacterium]